MPTKISKSEKIALQIAKTISPVDLDLDEVGYFLAKLKPATHYNRLILIAEAAVAEQEKDDIRYNNTPLF